MTMRILTLAALAALACSASLAVAQTQPGRLTVTGALVGGGVECPLLRADDGRLYSLAGDTGGFRSGERVRVEGDLAEVSICQQGATIQVRRIAEAE